MEKNDQNSSRRHRDERSSSRRSLRRKLNEEHGDSNGSTDHHQLPVDLHQELLCQIRTQVEILDSALPSSVEGRESAKNAVTILSELAKNGKRNSIMSRNGKHVLELLDFEIRVLTDRE